ncbi:MAG: hypothetical protein MI724_19325 [Spirochaetales bacterium]|nr:hypothetical protein [Spirochaetales bacterium]
MHRWACVSIDAFRLQVLLRTYDDRYATPIAVVDREVASGIITHANRRAVDSGVCVGMRYSHGLSIEPHLRAHAVSLDAETAALDDVERALSSVSPDVERCDFDTGVFWLNPTGLGSFFGSHYRWMGRVTSLIAAHGFAARVGIGYGRFGIYLATKTLDDSHIFSSPQDEREAYESAPIDLLPIETGTIELLRRLDIHTIGRLQALPSETLRRRFPRDARILATLLASEESETPIQPREWSVPNTVTHSFDDPIRDLGRLEVVIDTMLERLYSNITGEKTAISEVDLAMRFEDGSTDRECVRSAVATRDAAVYRRLIRLRLNRMYTHRAAPRNGGYKGNGAASGIDLVTLSARHATIAYRQTTLFSSAIERTAHAGERAFAMIRAAFGNDAVRCAGIVADHIPERRFEWHPIERPAALSRRADGALRSIEIGRSIRRIFLSPRRAMRSDVRAAIHARTGHRSKAIPHPPNDGVVIAGPFSLHQRWWDTPVVREYYYVARPDAAIAWLYHDLTARRWEQQGVID